MSREKLPIASDIFLLIDGDEQDQFSAGNLTNLVSILEIDSSATIFLAGTASIGEIELSHR
jgi:hypothetical protein